MSWNVAAKLNPEFVRAARVVLPRRRAVFLAALTLALLAAGGWLLWQKADPTAYVRYHGTPMFEAERHAVQVEHFGRASFEALTVVLFCLLFIVAPATAGISFVSERLRGTAVFQQMTLLSPLKQATGKLLGSGLFAYFVAAILLPPALAAAWLGGTNPQKVLRIYLFLFVGAMCWQAIGLFVSASLSASGEKAERGGLLIGPLVGVGGAITAVMFSHYFTADLEELSRAYGVGAYSHSNDYYYNYYVERQHYWRRFYGAVVPAYAVVLGVLAFAGAWAFAGAVRRVKAWQLIPTGPRAVWLFFASAEAVVVGLLWGRYEGDIVPNERLVIYLLLNSVALFALAGGSALDRNRLREWWSGAAGDAVALFQRGEVKNALKTFLIVLGVAEAGLVALWTSYHLHPLTGELQSVAFVTDLTAVAACFGAAMLGMVAFVQFCAMFRFRFGGWAGVGLTAVFYVFVTLAGALFGSANNTFALLNPLFYTEAITKGDTYLDSRLDRAALPDDGTTATARAIEEKIRYEPPKPTSFTLNYREPADSAVFHQRRIEYNVNSRPDYDTSDARAHGLFAEGLLALFCLGLAHLKWTRTREEMLRGDAADA